MKKNVCLLIYDLRSGGAERVISQWSALLSDDFNVYMTLYDKGAEVCYPYSGQLVYLDAPSNNKNVITKIQTVLKRARLLSKFVRKNHIDIVISFCNECNLVNTISLHHAKKICSIRSFSDLNANPFVKIVVKSSNNKLIIQTEALKAIMKKRYGEEIKKKIIVFGNPFDNVNIRRMSVLEPPESIRMILETKKTIVNVASFKPQKNHANLLRSFELVAEKLDDVYLLLIGADSTGRKQNVYEMAQKSRFKDRIIFVGELTNPYAVMSRASVFVLPSLAEGIPNVLAEAMICGTPVISTNCPTGPAELLSARPESIVFDTCGYEVVDYGIITSNFGGLSEYNYDDIGKDNKIFADAIIQVLENRELREELVKKSNEGAKRFDISQYRSELVELVSSLLE